MLQEDEIVMNGRNRYSSSDSTSNNGIRKRDEINPRHCWNLDDIYTGWEAWEQDLPSDFSNPAQFS